MESKYKPFSVMPPLSTRFDNEKLPEDTQMKWLLRKLSTLETALTVLTKRIESTIPDANIDMVMKLAAKDYALPGTQIEKRMRILEIRCLALESILFHHQHHAIQC